MHVIFVEPAFPSNQRQFVRALAQVGARVSGIGERPYEAFDSDLRSWLSDYHRIRSVVDEGALYEAVRSIQGKSWVDRMEATIEAHILPAARVREAAQIPGTTVKTAFLCRDKPAMKEALRAAGVPCARSLGTDSAEEARRFARETGYPLIVKPRSAAGASGTTRVDDEAALDRALAEQHVGRGGSVALEEFIEGHEGFYDTISIAGQPLHEFVTHYYPGVLEAMRNRWISPVFITTNRLNEPGYDEVKAMGRKVIGALGIETSATHMEWFYGPKGLSFSEIGCRPPGVGAWDVYSAANEFDIYREWAMAIVHGRGAQTPSRRFSAAMLSLRPTQDGQIVRYDGLDSVERRYGQWITDMHLPPEGSGTQPIEAGYMANAWMRVRHPDYDELRRMLTDISETLRVVAA